MSKLKNYTSGGRNTFEKIQEILSYHGAQKIMFDYENRKVAAISFAMEIEGQIMGFKIPAYVENVTQILYGGKDRWNREKKITQLQKDQAYKTAWANIRDWIDAQMALVATKQAKINHIFLPYLVMGNGETLANHIEKNPSLLLGSGK